jgi:hypothetical protein
MAGKAIVLKVDTERYPQVAGCFDIRGIPNFIRILRWPSGLAAGGGGKSRANGAMVEDRCQCSGGENFLGEPG